MFVCLFIQVILGVILNKMDDDNDDPTSSYYYYYYDNAWGG